MAEPTIPAAQGTEQPVTESVVLTPREEVIKKYQSTYEQVPVAPAVSEAPVAEPVTAAEPASMAAELERIKTEILSAVQSMLPQAPVPSAPSTPPVASVVGEPEDWVKLLSEGKRAEGEAAMRKALGIPDRDAIIAETLERSRAENEIAQFVHSVKSAPENQEALKFEPYIFAIVNNTLESEAYARQNSGKPPMSPVEYVQLLKKTVSDEMDKARKLATTLRGEGKIEATTRSREVVASTTLKPNSVQELQPSSSGAPAIESDADYMAKRQAQIARQRGLSVN